MVTKTMSAQQVANAQAAANQQINDALVKNCLNAWQQVYSNTFSGATNGPGTIINVPLKNVGLNKRLLVKVTASITAAAGKTANLTTLGSANFFSNVTLSDLSNNIRINTSGWHLTTIASVKSRQPFGSAIKNASTDTPFGYGNNFTNVQQAPAQIAATTSTVNAYFEVPIAYSDHDLRGAIWAGVVNAAWYVQLTVNPGMFVVTGVDSTLAMYQNTDASVATLGNYTITIYQNYLDQLPVVNGQTLLPLLNLATNYIILNTSFSGLTANQPLPIPYPNFRDILSTTVIYDNAGVLNPGTDISTFGLQAANLVNIFQYDPTVPALFARQNMQADMPLGMYYFSHRAKPVSTVQYGNIALNVTPSAVTGSTSTLLVGFETMGIVNNVVNAGSIAGS